MINYIQKGEVITVVAPAAVDSGDGVLVGATFGVALADAENGADVNVQLVGVFELPKASGAISQGAKVYWDNTAGDVTTTSTSNTLIGIAIEAEISAATTVKVRLNGSF